MDNYNQLTEIQKRADTISSLMPKVGQFANLSQIAPNASRLLGNVLSKYKATSNLGKGLIISADVSQKGTALVTNANQAAGNLSNAFASSLFAKIVIMSGSIAMIIAGGMLLKGSPLKIKLP